MDRREWVGGLTTFFTMSYIVVVNPSILAADGTGIPFSGALTATVLLCASMTLLMGFYAKLPFGVAPGMGINAFFTYTLILGMGVAWPVALGMVFWAGVLFLLASVTKLREQIAEAIPPELKIAVAVGIGLFLTFIGLKNSGFIVADPVTFVKLGPLGIEVGLALVGMAVILFFVHRKSPFAYLLGILVVTLLAWAGGQVAVPTSPFSAPDFSLFLAMDPIGALKLALVPAILSLFFTDLFDSLATFIGVSTACGLVDERGKPKRLREGLIVDAWATLSGGIFGTSSGTAYIESASGIEAGGRTGKTAVVTGLCFVPCLFLAPMAAMVPLYATAPVLVAVGAMLFQSVRLLRFDTLEESIPPFLTIVLIPLTFSITQGILWGFVSHVTLYAVAGRVGELPPLRIGLGVLSLILLYLERGV